MNLLRRHPGFRWLWIGQMLSQLGNAVFLIMGLWEIQLRSPLLLAVAGLVMVIPSLLAVVGGVVVDRSDPRRLMLWTDVMRGSAVLLGLLALAVPGALLPVIIVLLGINSLGNALFGPAEGVLLPWLMPADDLATGNGLYSLTSQLSSAIGSALGGAAIAAVGVTLVFGADLASFWLSAVAIWLMMRVVAARPRTAPAASAPGGSGLMAELKAGWAAAQEIPGLVKLLPWVVVANFAFVAAFTMFPFWVRHVLHASVVSYGLIDASWAVGLVVGSLIVGRFRHLPLRVSTAYMFGAQGVLIGVFALLHAPLFAGATLLVAGVANGCGNALTFAMMQRLIPEHARGRVFGLAMTLFGLANPLGALAAGAFLPLLPLWWAWALGALTSLLVAVGLRRWIPLDIDGTLPAAAAVQA